MTARRTQQGFTIVELMFAMAFVAFIMIFIVTSIVQTMRIYNKGLAIRQINQSGRQLGEELTRSLRYSSASQFTASGYPAGQQRVCANGVSYAWNLEGDAGLGQNVKYATPNDGIPLRFVRIDDKAGDMCKPGYPPIPKNKSTELLSSQLVIRKFELSSAEGGRIVNIKTVISTQDLNMPKTSTTSPSGFSCPTDGSGAYCAFGDFITTVYIRN